MFISIWIGKKIMSLSNNSNNSFYRPESIFPTHLRLLGIGRPQDDDSGGLLIAHLAFVLSCLST